MRQLFCNITLVLCVVVLFNQCKKDNVTPDSSQEIGEKLGEIKLTPIEHEIVSYQLGDSVIIKDSLGNVQSLLVKSRKTFLHRYYKNGGTDSSTDYYDIENLVVVLEDSYGKIIRLELTAPLPIYVSNNHINKNSFSISTNLASFKNGYATGCLVDETNFYYNSQGTAIPYHSTFTILGKSYSAVYELINDSPEKIYFNRSQGVVGFKADNGVFWYLDN